MLTDGHRVKLRNLGVLLALSLLPKALPALHPAFTIYWLLIFALFCCAFLYGLWHLLKLLYAFFKRRALDPHRGNVVFALQMGVLFTFMVVALRFVPSALPSGSHKEVFRSEAWLESDSARYRKDGPTPRQMMLASLIDELERGVSRHEVVAMLGEPHSKDFPLGIGTSDIHYRTGPQRDALFGLDSEWIFIWFDEAENFQEYQIYVD